MPDKNSLEDIKRQIRETTAYKNDVKSLGEPGAEHILDWVVADDVTPACCYHCPYVDCSFYKRADQIWSMSCERYTEYKNTGVVGQTKLSDREILDKLLKCYRNYLDEQGCMPVDGYSNQFYDGVLWAFARLTEIYPSDG